MGAPGRQSLWFCWRVTRRPTHSTWVPADPPLSQHRVRLLEGKTMWHRGNQAPAGPGHVVQLPSERAGPPDLETPVWEGGLGRDGTHGDGFTVSPPPSSTLGNGVSSSTQPPWPAKLTDRPPPPPLRGDVSVEGKTCFWVCPGEEGAGNRNRTREGGRTSDGFVHRQQGAERGREKPQRG